MTKAARPAGTVDLILNQIEAQRGEHYLRDNLVTLDLETAEITNVTKDSLWSGVLRWRGELVLVGWREEDTSVRVWRLDDRRRPVPLIPGTEMVTGAAVSPDGQTLAYCTGRYYDEPEGTIALVDDVGSSPAVVHRCDRHLADISYLADGRIIAVESATQRRKQHLLVLDGDHVAKLDVSSLGPKWKVTFVHGGPDGHVVMAAEEGPEMDTRQVSALLELVDRELNVKARLRGWQPVAVARDHGAVLMAHPVPGPMADLVWCRFGTWEVAGWIGRIPAFAPEAGWWETSPPPAEYDGIYLHDFAWQPPEPPKRRKPRLERLTVGPEEWDRLDEYAGELVVQLRGDDHDLLATVLTAARDDLYWLDTSRQDDGETEIPSSVSPVRPHPNGPWVSIDANDTEPELMRRIPSILERHLAAHDATATLSFWLDDIVDGG
jgi:hypothetical protein